MSLLQRAIQTTEVLFANHESPMKNQRYKSFPAGVLNKIVKLSILLAVVLRDSIFEGTYLQVTSLPSI